MLRYQGSSKYHDWISGEFERAYYDIKSKKRQRRTSVWGRNCMQLMQGQLARTQLDMGLVRYKRHDCIGKLDS